MSRTSLAVACCAILSGCATPDGLSGAPASDVARSTAGAGGFSAAPLLAPATKSTDPDFVEERARHAYATGRWDVAEGYYLQLTRMKPREAEAWFQLGNLYAEQGRLDSAERAYREALRRRDDARTLHNLGLVQIKLGVGALREAQKRLPPDDSTRRETREFLRMLLEATAQ